MSPDKAAKANQEMRNLLALGLIQPSYSPWASGIVMVKKKTGENLHKHRLSVGLLANTIKETRQKENGIPLRNGLI